MTASKVTEAEFIRIWRETGSPQRTAEIVGTSVRAVHARRNTIERKRGIVLAAADDQSKRGTREPKLPSIGIRRLASITGHVIVFSDAHFWPGDHGVAYKALIEVLRDLKPTMVVANGDILDGSRISRHDRIGWEKRPTLKDELAACREAMDSIRSASRRATHVWNLGNHDTRFARYLANNAPEMEGLLGSDLDDHIPHWEIGWSLMINDNTMVKHRAANGIHATHNNALKSGRNIVTGHLHRLQATNWVDYNGCRWGVDTGTLSDVGPHVGAFFYTEDNPASWCSGFAVLTFTASGAMLHPEFCYVADDNVAYFRGQKVYDGADQSRGATVRKVVRSSTRAAP